MRELHRSARWSLPLVLVSTLSGVLGGGCAGGGKANDDTAAAVVPGGSAGIPVPGPCDPLGSCGWTDVSMATVFGCGIREGGTVDCWGDFQLGGDEVLHGVGFTDVAVGMYHACALKRDGLPACWADEGMGDNDRGQVDPPTVPFVAIEAGAYLTCGLDAGGFITCWGYYLGSRPPPGPFVQMDLGFLGGCALDAEGRVTCWGDDVNQGRVAANPEGRYLRVACGGSCYGVATSGHLVSFGPRLAVVASPPEGERFMDVSLWGTLACGLTTAGELRCWGEAHPGGYYDLDADWDTVRYPEGPFTKIGVGSSSVCAIRADGTISCMDSCGRPDYEAPYWSPYPGPCT